MNGGVVLASRDPRGASWIEQFDANGQRIERVRGYGGPLASDGTHLVEITVSRNGRNVVARAGTSPTALGAWHTVGRSATEHRLNLRYDVAMTPGDRALVAWWSYPADGCGVWVRAIDAADGTPGGNTVCAAPPRIGTAHIGTTGGGRPWLAWSDLACDSYTEVCDVWVRALAVD